MHPKEATFGLHKNQVGDLTRNAQPFMVIIDIRGGLMPYRAVYAERTLALSVKGMCHVQKMKKVGACELNNNFKKLLGLKDLEHAFPVHFLYSVNYRTYGAKRSGSRISRMRRA